MAENSAISWTDHTFNPWWGCTKVGPGCDHCYAETFDKRVGGSHWGAGAPRRLIKDWSAPRKWQRQAEKTGERPWVFCASMADVFDNEVPGEWRERLWQLVRETPLLLWIFVTKRIGNAAKMLPADWPEAFPHCGLCITVVDQAEADRDVPKLINTPAAWRGISAEPLIGSIDFTTLHLPPIDFDDARGKAHWGDALTGCHGCFLGYSKVGSETFAQQRFGKLDWIIVGGESGPHARPMHPDWARAIRDQCVAAGVAFHFKQFGSWQPAGDCGTHFVSLDGKLTSTDRALPHPDDAAVSRIPKPFWTRLLDGREHNAMPEVRL